MMNKTLSLAFAAACVAVLGAMPAHAQYYPQQPMQPYAGPPVVENQMVTNGPQASRGDFGDWSARRNVIESARYDRLLQTSWGFRHARMRKECGRINDPQLHQQCIASFDQFEPAMVGSSSPPRRLHHTRGAGY